MRKIKYIVLCLLLGAVQLTGCGKEKEFIYKEHLADTILSVDEKEISLGELSFYIAYEEDLVQQQALIYSPEKPETYWNVHINGRFLVEVVKDEMIKMVVRDEILYTKAMERGIVLTDAQRNVVEEKKDEVWGKLSKTQQEALGITEDEFLQYVIKMGCVELYVEQLAQENEVGIEAYAVSGNHYLAELALHNVQVQEEVWEKVKLGRITIER